MFGKLNVVIGLKDNYLYLNKNDESLKKVSIFDNKGVNINNQSSINKNTYNYIFPSKGIYIVRINDSKSLTFKVLIQ